MSIYDIGEDILDDDYPDYEYWCQDCKKYLDIDEWEARVILGMATIFCKHCGTKSQRIYEEGLR